VKNNETHVHHAVILIGFAASNHQLISYRICMKIEKVGKISFQFDKRIQICKVILIMYLFITVQRQYHDIIFERSRLSI
jgi:hypothetical protein